MGSIEARIRALSAWAEVIVVVVIAFGDAVYGSMRAVIDIVRTGTVGPPDTEAGVIGLVVLELIVLLVLGWFLRVRGWTIDNLGLDPSWGDGARRLAVGVALRAAQGIVLGLAVVLAYQIAVIALWGLLGQRVRLAEGAQMPAALGVFALLGLLVINSIFEEVFLCGYLITRLADMRGLWFAVNVSTALRLSYHLYQGSAGIPSIIAMGLIFAIWFARTHQLWPPIVAHAWLNLMAWINAS
jgi:membrane protease YdiL (CAAX protease family)